MKTSDWQANIQLLVDGELTHARRSEFLRGLSSDSKGWRDIALAFVERQVLDESLAAKKDPRQTSILVQMPAEKRKIRPSSPSGKQLDSRSTRQWRSAALWSATIAACFFIGLALGKWGNPSTTSNRDSVAAIADTPSNPQPLAKTPQENDGGIPLADALARAVYPIPVELRRELMKRGYLITELDQLSKVQLPTGQLVEIPVRQVAVTYLGNATYQ